MSAIKHISVIGNGGWGTTLAVHLAKKNAFEIKLWGAFPEEIREIRSTRINQKYLPGITIPENVILEEDLGEALRRAELIVLATPSQYTKDILKKLKKFDLSGKKFLSVIKGIETKSLKRISQIILEELGNVPLAILSGPTIASEVAKGIPTTAVIAAKGKLAPELQDIFHSEEFRIYTNGDIIGVELGGSIKNVIAIACGVCDGLGLGTNAKAAIVTRGLSEISRLGVFLGAKSKTFSGLTGLGDLVTTCFSPQSRNRTVGEELGRGKNIKEITGSMHMVAEGVATAESVYRLSKKHNIPMPISTAIYNIIYKEKSPRSVLKDLLGRETRAE